MQKILASFTDAKQSLLAQIILHTPLPVVKIYEWAPWEFTLVKFALNILDLSIKSHPRGHIVC